MIVLTRNIDRFNEITRLISKLEYSYELLDGGMYRLSFDEELDRKGISSTSGLTLTQITEKITLEQLKKAVNNSLNAGASYQTRRFNTLQGLINSFSWGESPEGSRYWGDLYDITT